MGTRGFGRVFSVPILDTRIQSGGYNVQHWMCDSHIIPTPFLFTMSPRPPLISFISWSVLTSAAPSFLHLSNTDSQQSLSLPSCWSRCCPTLFPACHGIVPGLELFIISSKKKYLQGNAYIIGTDSLISCLLSFKHKVPITGISNYNFSGIRAAEIDQSQIFISVGW